MIDAYPLAWPPGWKRTQEHQRTRAKFGKTQHNAAGYQSFARGVTIAEGATRVLRELERFGVARDAVIISTNLRPRLDGLPLSKQRIPQDPGVAVYWKDGAEQKCMAIDRYADVADNLAAVAATIEAMRAIERHGGAQILARAFQGFTALPAPGQTSARSWRDVLDVSDAQVDMGTVTARYRLLRSKYHPDKGTGDRDKFEEVQTAYAQAQAALAP